MIPSSSSATKTRLTGSLPTPPDWSGSTQISINESLRYCFTDI